MLRRQFVVRDEEELITCFDPDAGDTLHGAIADLITHFHEPDGDGYDGSDMVIWRGGRILAVVRLGENGEPIATVFDPKIS
jgi:hypothetical protein